VALSNAERQRRYIARLKAAGGNTAPKAESATPPAGAREDDPSALRAEIKKLQSQIKAGKTRFEKLRAEKQRLFRSNAAAESRLKQQTISRDLYRRVLACLHPDRISDRVLKLRYEDTFKDFAALKFKFFVED
jgi:hypothetical protein